MQRIASIAGIFALAAAPLAAQTIRGRVVDARTGQGVPQAAVHALTDGGRRAGQARTGDDGKFSLPVRSPGQVRLRVDRTGYRETLTAVMPVAAQETIDVELSISTAPLALAPLRVTARVEPPRRRNLELNGFYERERRGIGEFVRREEIERHGDWSLAQSLSRVPGTAIHYIRVHQYIYFPRNGGCRPHVFLDGVRIIVDGANDINSIVSPTQVEALEVFRGPSEIPVEYNSGRGACGVILIWTKHES
ncbi:MAG TPA: TonB-dependent receptor [Longimicrobium sp.]|jgi:hypothetical protein|nr:TonB-dependent receptor [Longimicrobium sp.]